MPSPEDQALIEAHVEHLVGVELANRKEIATLQTMVLELRERLGEAERLLDSSPHWLCNKAYVGGTLTGCGDCWDCRRRAFLAPSPPDSPPTADDGFPMEFARKVSAIIAGPAASPVSTVDSQLAALDARVAALEKLGKDVVYGDWDRPAHVCSPNKWSDACGGWVCLCGKAPSADWYTAWRKGNP